MAKITRKTAKLFASNAGVNQVGEFGSFQVGSPAFTTDPAVIQSLSAYLVGWFAAVSGPNSPCIEDMNAVCLVFAYQLAYLMQEGISEWDSGTTYFKGSLVTDTGGLGLVYKSLTDNNLNNVVTQSNTQTNWALQDNTTVVTLDPSTQSPYLMVASDLGKDIMVNSANGAQSITLPAPSVGARVKIIDSGFNCVVDEITINPHSGEKIQNSTSPLIMTFNGGFVELTSNGTDWFVTAKSDNQSAWAAYTPTFAGVGTPSLVSFEWRRVGTDVEIRGGFACGTTTGATLTIALPAGITLSTTVNYALPLGDAFASGTGARPIYTQGKGDGFIYIAVQDASSSAINSMAGNYFLVVNNVVSIQARGKVPNWGVY